jgi:hypothetical protein
MYLLCVKDTTVAQKECVLFFFPDSPVQHAIILLFFKDIFKFKLYFGKCVIIKSTNTYLSVIYSCGLWELLGLTDYLKSFLADMEGFD